MQVCSVCSRCFSDAETRCVNEDHPPLTAIQGRRLDSVPGYQIETLLEGSGPGEQYSAKQTNSDAKCVITLVPLNGADANAFQNEASAAAAIFHPNITDIIESGVLESGDAYSVALHPETRNLRDLLNEGAVPLLTTIQIIRETAEAVHALHSNGITHGAIRPTNVLVADAAMQHRVKLQNPDFAGALRHSIVSNKLTIDSSMEVIRYFAPEQFSPKTATPQTDVYSLGVVLFEMLSGKPPFEGETAAELIEKIRDGHPPDVEINNFDLRMLLTHALMQSLQKQPDLRQPTALAFARQIRHIEQLATHSTTPPIPFPAAIPQKRAAAAGAGQTSPRATSRSANNRKTVEITNVKKLDLQAVKRPDPPPIVSEIKAKETATAISGEPLAKADSTGDLNRSRLRSWKEKYQAAASSFTSNAKSTFQQLSISESEPPQRPACASKQIELTEEAAASAPPPKRIKIEWAQPVEDLPSIEQVKKLRVQDPILEDQPAQTRSADSDPGNLAPAVAVSSRKTETQLFDSYKKPSRRKREAPIERRAGLFSILPSSVSGASIDRRIIVAGFAFAVIIGLFFGSSLLESETVSSAKPETPGTKTAPALVEEKETAPQTRQDTALDVNEAEAPPEIPVRAYDETARSVPPKQPASKKAAPDAVQDPKPKVPAAVQTQAVSKPASVKNRPKAALTPSTLVITPGNGKVKSKVEPGNGSAFTRPRVVANPKP